MFVNKITDKSVNFKKVNILAVNRIKYIAEQAQQDFPSRESVASAVDAV